MDSADTNQYEDSGGPRVSAASFEAALGRLSEAVLIVDETGQIAWRNDSAEKLMTADAALRCTSGALAAPGAAHQRRLLAALEGAANGPEPVTLLARAGNRSLVLRAQRLWQAQERGRKLLLVTIRIPQRRARLGCEQLMSLFGLTVAEARVASEIGAAARRIPDVAKSLRIANNTVKTLLQRVYEKTGAHSQSELVLLLARAMESQR